MTEHQRRDPVEPQSETIDFRQLEAEDFVADDELVQNIEEESPEQPAVKDAKKPKGSRPRKEITTEHLIRLLEFDREVLLRPRKKEIQIVIGTDEVGRGCLAGPVMACAVIMPEIDHASDIALKLARLNDSKQVNPELRKELSEILRGMCQYAIGEASVEEIDTINILQASLLAMRRAIRRLKVDSPAVILVDGNKQIKSIKNIQQETVIDGDTKSASIAAASIIAKVHRDAFMTKLARKFPHYKWESNKGYRSKVHWDAINEHGMSPWHRRSFVEHWLNAPEQLTLDLDGE